jgi:chemotaxis-related protein WspB
MLFLLFELGPDRYALEAGRIVEILPLVDLKRIPRAPPEVAGILRYRGVPVPVIDLCEVALGRAAQRRLSTRIVLVQPSDESGREHLLGLIAEAATETLRREPSDFTPSGIANGAAPYLGPVIEDARGLIQWVDVDRLLTEPVRALVFDEPVAR